MTGTTPAGATEVLLKDADGTMVLWRRSVLVQVRRGQLTAEVLQRAGAALRPLLREGHPLGALFVLEPTAAVPTDEIRAMQASLLDELTAHAPMRMAAVILGEGVTPSLNRSAGRLVAMGKRSLQRFSDERAGEAWLAAQLSALGAQVTAEDLAAVVRQARG
jgi:hypothetical protein